MNKIPEVVKICGMRWNVIEDAGLLVEELKFGKCDYRTTTMTIDKALAQDHKEQTLLHEIVEAINIMMRLNLEENTVEVFAQCLYQVLTDNSLDFSRDK